jgi:hypothetical protein
MAALAFVCACSWELPVPRIARDAVPNDRVDANAVNPVDASIDRSATPIDMPVVDVSIANDVITQSDALDVPDVPDVTDVSDVRDVPDVFDPECALGTFRACPGSDAGVMGRGVCRPSVQFCEAPGRWSTRCEPEVARDCAGRMCGSDGCEGSCGTCPMAQSCDDTGRCAPTRCGMANFNVPCGRGNCPANGVCTPDGRCICASGYEARRCNGEVCAAGVACDYPDWWCAPAPFCGGGAIVCAGSFLCPRWSVCDEVGRSCLCRPGFEARRCDGVPCTSCADTAYECVPLR